MPDLGDLHANAPADDEADDDPVVLAEARADIAAGRTVPLADVLRELEM